MVNILLEGYDLDAAWLYDDLKAYIKPDYKVAVVAFSFRDNRVKNNSDWELLYSKERGKYYSGIVNSFGSYGILEQNICFVNYFEDSKESAKTKIANADIIYFLGGLPDRMMNRIKDFDLLDLLAHHNKVVVGYSAGAAVQLAEYHLSPDHDYPNFNYYNGIPYLKDFYLQVHFENTDEQLASINKVLKERGKPVYATHTGKGAVIVENGRIKTVGIVTVFNI